MISIVIPVKNGGSRLRECLEAISAQHLDEPVEVIVIDSGSTDGTPMLARSLGARVHEIPAFEFNHGTTRNLGARLAEGEIVVYTVDDALPMGDDWLAELVAPLRTAEGVGASYGRQVPRTDTPLPQRYYIASRYGPEPRVQRSTQDGDVTLKSIMFSNVCSAIRRDLLSRFPFPGDVNTSEDMEWARRVLLAGEAIAYVPTAAVRHSHAYTIGGAFKRYFDQGAAAERTVLAGAGSSGGKVRSAGVDFVRAELAWMWRNGHRRWIPYTVVLEGVKYLGFIAGTNHKHVPPFLRRRWTHQPFYWSKEAERARDRARSSAVSERG